MRQHTILNIATALALGATFTLASMSTAQNQALQQRNQSQRMNRSNFGQLDNVTKGQHFRASQVIGANIYNLNEESVGEISDVVIDSRTGKIAYAAVTYGGFLGIGDKMFAVPWEAFQVKADKDDRDDYHLCLDVSQKKLEGDQGFDQDNWPNFADRNWTMQLDKRYGVDSRMRNRDNRRENRRGRDGNVDVDVNSDGVDVDVDRNRNN